MAFLRQTWTLTKKNLKVVLVRQFLSTLIRAFLMPIIFMFFISYAKNFFIPPSEYGIGAARPVRSFTNALDAAQGGRNTVVFVNNGHTGGDIERVITSLSDVVRGAGKTAQVVQDDVDLLTACRSSLRGVSACYGAASFHSSPTEGSGGAWNYTLRADGAFEERVYVSRADNDPQIYILPFQHAIDTTIAQLNGTSTSDVVNEIPYTDETEQQRNDRIRHLYMTTLINILGLAFFIGIVGITYQLTGLMAAERELGISQLIEAMTPNSKAWHTQAARLMANHLAFDIIYLPGWIIMGLIVRAIVFPSTSYAIPVILHLLTGLALSSFSIMGAALFRRAQLSGISVVLVAIVLAIVAQVTKAKSSAAVAILSLLFTPMNYTYFIIYNARFERADQAVNLVKGAPPREGISWQLPGIVLWIFLVVQIFVFPVIGAWIERSLYGTASKSRKMTLESSTDPPESVRLTEFSKHWMPSWWHRNVACKFGVSPKETVIAVNKLTLRALRGNIMVLLGANGSGKSTTLDSISGLNTITSGSIEIDGTGGLGLCPQKNVLWDDLTVFEHVKIFNELKAATADSKTQIEDLVRRCDLLPKLKAKSKTLSGGQKRKLQLAMMFTGGSRVCCVDEVSSGIDPLSRRKIWDILLAERGARTMLLTTHFLDEADFLSDYIVVLSKGNLKAEGSAVELKHRLGGGYRIILDNSIVRDQPKALDGIPHQVLFDQTVYQVADSAQAAELTAKLEDEGLSQYQVNGPTIEDVFLRLAEEVEVAPDNDDNHPEPVKAGQNASSHVAVSEQSSAMEAKQEAEPIALSKGRSTSFFEQTYVLFHKRMLILANNWMPYAAAVLIPIIAAGLTTLFLHGFTGASCDPGASASNPTTVSLALDVFSGDDILIPVGPSSRVSVDTISKSFPLTARDLHFVESSGEFTSYIQINFGNATPGGFFLDSTPTMAYIANGGVYYALMTQNLLDNVLYNTTIQTQFQSFAVPFSPNAGDTLQLILYFGLAMCAYTGFFALYPTVERVNKVRALHYSNGIRAAPLWVAYVLFDFCFVLLISVVVTIIYVGVSGVWYAPGYLFVVFFLYGFTSILLAYVVSLFVTSQLAAFAFMAGGQAAFFLIYFVAYMCILTYIAPADIDRDVTLAHFTIALITPAGNLLRALLLSLNEFSLLCDGDAVRSYPGDLMAYGGPILYLICQALVLFIFLVWWDSGYKPAILTRNSYKPPDSEQTSHMDPDVLVEARRTEQSDDRLRVVHLTKRFSRRKPPAVRDVTFGVPTGQTFALLGPNGAGKSTTISLIRGDLHPTAGDAFISSHSISRHRAAARLRLGVCPQFDAVDTLTVTQHLTFYARARGIPSSSVAANVSAAIAAVGLPPDMANRPAPALSGGNRRKLSLAVALTADPDVLLLDEPSSGMDAAAKRAMWRALCAPGVAARRAVLLTTHSMEEAEAVAGRGRVGVVGGEVLGVGSIEQLRRRWGRAWVVGVSLADEDDDSSDADSSIIDAGTPVPASRAQRTQRVRDWIAAAIPSAQLDSRVGVGGGVRFVVPIVDDKVDDDGQRPGGLSIARLFNLLETRGRREAGIGLYSVGRTTLDEVFVAMVQAHDVAEEGEGEGRKG
ncbi:nod factor export ATP-binding protein I [Phyllosticta capitalensis]|uniref:Nod factor export ATP-binding protein I n=1 Tax=Phyllosticta capitalensis TaxID=121624 RepID=A0ABR1Y8U3_9PEZI